MNKLEFNQDEFSTSEEQIEYAEKIWGTEFPQEYKSFLLRQNGGEVYPNTPFIETTTECELWWIERFCSTNDLILQKRYPMGYTYIEQHQEEDLEVFNISRNELLTIAVAGRGCYYINLSKEQYGQIYHANYQGGDGIVRLKTRSFDEFLNSMKPYDENYAFEGFNNSRKIYDISYFDTPNNPELGLNRFDEVMAKIGNANSKSRESDWTVIQYYASYRQHNKMKKHIFNHLFKPDINMEGLLRRSMDYEIILQLVLEYGQDYNKPYKGIYPIHCITSGSMSKIKEDYELLDKLIKSDIEIDYNIKDSKGKNVIERIKEMNEMYKKYIEREKRRWKTRPEMLNYTISEEINKLVN